MKRRTFRVARLLSVAGAIVVTGPVALAQPPNTTLPQQPQSETPAPQALPQQQAESEFNQGMLAQDDWRSAHEGLVGAALRLDSINSAQRSAIEQIAQQRRAADVGVRQADGLVLRMLAQQVEAGSVKPQLLRPGLSAEESAAAARSTVDASTLNQLHAILTPDQRNQLIDRVQARIAERQEQAGEEPFQGSLAQELQLTPEQRSQIQANLQAQGGGRTGITEAQGRMTTFFDAFRSESFDATQFARARAPGEHLARVVQAMMPVLTPTQRGVLAGHLRKAAARSP
jgi:Spy/CpxP family protein refolding chaperone